MLTRMCPEIQVTTVPTEVRMHIYPLRMVYWLCLGMLRPAPDMTPFRLWEKILNPNRIRMALETVISNGLDMSPCSLSVARARLTSLKDRVLSGLPVVRS